MIESRGYLLAVSSLAVVTQVPGLAAYSASKAGIEALCNSLRIEVAHEGVGVGVAYFPWIDTEIVRGARRSPLGSQMLKASGPFGRGFAADGAAQALVRGIERRSRTVVHPAWMRPMLPLRGVVQPALDGYSRVLAPVFDRTGRRDRARRGATEASAPLGQGGEADRRLGGS